MTIFYYRVALGYLDRMAAGEAGPDNPEGYPQEKIDDAASSLYGNIGNLYYEIDSLPRLKTHQHVELSRDFCKKKCLLNSSFLHHFRGELCRGMDVQFSIEALAIPQDGLVSHA